MMLASLTTCLLTKTSVTIGKSSRGVSKTWNDEQHRRQPLPSNHTKNWRVTCPTKGRDGKPHHSLADRQRTERSASNEERLQNRSPTTIEPLYSVNKSPDSSRLLPHLAFPTQPIHQPTHLSMPDIRNTARTPRCPT